MRRDSYKPSLRKYNFQGGFQVVLNCRLDHQVVPGRDDDGIKPPQSLKLSGGCILQEDDLHPVKCGNQTQ